MTTEGGGTIYQGIDAGLSHFRHFIETNNNELFQVSLQQYLQSLTQQSIKQPLFLLGDDNDDDNDDDNNNEQEQVQQSLIEQSNSPASILVHPLHVQIKLIQRTNEEEDGTDNMFSENSDDDDENNASNNNKTDNNNSDNNNNNMVTRNSNSPKDDDDDNENSNMNITSSAVAASRWISGTLFITSECLCFIASSSSPSLNEYQNYDLRVDAVCIDLHAISNSNSTDDDNGDDEAENNNHNTDDNENKEVMMLDKITPKQLIYLQISCDNIFWELFIQPTTDNDTNTFMNNNNNQMTICQLLFDQISKLISLHPVLDDSDMDDTYVNDNSSTGNKGDDYYDNNNSNNGMISMMSIMNNNNHHYDDYVGMYEDAEEEENDDGDHHHDGIKKNANTNNTTLIGNNPNIHTTSPTMQNVDEAIIGEDVKEKSVRIPTEEERLAMLERLDNLLIVPHEYELPEDDLGQFDDADDDIL